MHISSSVRGWASAILAVLCLAVVWPGTAAAQVGGTIRGSVLDAGTQRPLVNARIVLVGQNREVRTNEQGQYEFRGIDPGQYTVQATFIGSGRADEIVAVSTGQVSTANFSLARAPVQLAVGITGVAGPGGGTREKPEGLVHFACAAEGQETVHARIQYGPIGRAHVRSYSVKQALEMLLAAARAHP